MGEIKLEVSLKSCAKMEDKGGYSMLNFQRRVYAYLFVVRLANELSKASVKIYLVCVHDVDED